MYVVRTGNGCRGKAKVLAECYLERDRITEYVALVAELSRGVFIVRDIPKSLTQTVIVAGFKGIAPRPRSISQRTIAK